MTKRILCIVVGAVALAGCGSDNPTSSNSSLCDKASSVAPRVAAKFTPCLPTGAPAVDTGIPTGQTCESQLANCTADDRVILNTALDCLDGLPNCSTATQTDFEAKATACDPSSKGLSAACSASFQ